MSDDDGNAGIRAVAGRGRDGAHHRVHARLQRVAIGAPTRVEVEGTRAYVIVPATYSFTAKGGVAMRARSQMTFTLEKDASGWLIHGWTWTGPKASKAGTTAK